MKQKPTKTCENGVQLRPASIEEAGLFYSELDKAQDEALGTIGHIRMDFGSGGKEFWHTWWPHNEDRFNTPEFIQGRTAGVCGCAPSEWTAEKSLRNEFLLLSKWRRHHSG